jgi:hypothetical protein
LIGPVESLTTLSDVDHLGVAVRQSQPDRNNWIMAICGGGVLRLTLELSSVSIHFIRGLAESDSASHREKKSGGRQIFEHLPSLSGITPRKGLHAAAGDIVSFLLALRAKMNLCSGKFHCVAKMPQQMVYIRPLGAPRRHDGPDRRLDTA